VYDYVCYQKQRRRIHFTVVQFPKSGLVEDREGQKLEYQVGQPLKSTSCEARPGKEVFLFHFLTSRRQHRATSRIRIFNIKFVDIFILLQYCISCVKLQNVISF
jgi:hypothetical protein